MSGEGAGVVEPFKIAVPEEKLRQLRQRILAYPWHAAAADEAVGWRYGPATSYLRELCDHWLHGWDWRREEERLNRFPQVLVRAGPKRLHAVHQRRGVEGRRALVLVHGWPGSFIEMERVIEPLVWPERHGGNPADGFDVIVPSLPGYGFSDRLSAPEGPRAAAAAVARLIRALGYEEYMVHGGDWGAEISVWLGFDDAHSCRGIHLAMRGLAGNEPLGPEAPAEERAWQQDSDRRLAQLGLYALMQTEETQTLGLALADSPVGAMAWILDKFVRWIDAPDARAVEALLGRDRLLSNIAIHLFTDTIASALWIYPGYMLEARSLPEGRRVERPVGIFALQNDPVYPWPSRSLLERHYNIAQWTRPARGAHFAALETPYELVEDLRGFARRIGF